MTAERISAVLSTKRRDRDGFGNGFSNGFSDGFNNGFSTKRRDRNGAARWGPLAPSMLG